MESRKSFFLFSPWFMGVLFIVFAMAMAFATFFENDFGAQAARKLVYETKWFEIIFLLMIVNLTGQIFQYKLFRKKKLTILLLHLSFVLIIIGAGITRYFGFEGTMHIREGKLQNKCLSTDQYLHFTIKDRDGEILHSDLQKLAVTAVSWDRYHQKLTANDIEYSLKLLDYKISPSGMGVILFNLNYNDKTHDLTLWIGENTDNTLEHQNNKHLVEVSYQPKAVKLPFSLKLEDFILERYPGSSSPSSYKSNVVLIDKDNNTRLPYSIYMNHILKYQGWRF
ncbi:MAG: cytochrome c biogenesis protein ResB, partial [Bacteroidales bacterium]